MVKILQLKESENKRASLKPLEPLKKESVQTIKNPDQKSESNEIVKEFQPVVDKITPDEKAVFDIENLNQNLSYAEWQKQTEQQKIIVKDNKLLSRDWWVVRKGHTFTYIGIFLFTFVLYFRPYELIPALASLNSLALIIAIATLLVYIPTQINIEGSITTLTTEIKCILFLAIWSFITIPIAKDPEIAWGAFSGAFFNVVLIFIIMVNVLRTQLRLKGLMWLSIGVGVMLSYQALVLYQKGEFETEGYRVNVDYGGMFGNPNALALHLVIFTPIAVALGIAAKNKLAKLIYFVATALMIGGNMVTQSRGGFLGLIATSAVLLWKFGRNKRLKVVLISSIIAVSIMAFAPGNYGLRVLSIFVPSLDPVHSSDERTELLKQSIIVTVRNPLGIGIGNFPVVGKRNRGTHNTYTQISSELGWLAFIVYLVFLISPLRKLSVLERQMIVAKDFSWLYYLSVGVKAGIIGYMVSSFFGHVGYAWYGYYPIAFAICLRRIYQTERIKDESLTER